jgi:tripartite-type tricarboxylate transporter receptor subunit TctC
MERRQLLALGAAWGLTGAWAQDPSTSSGQAQYPAKPVRLIVPYPPGGGNDSLARIVSQRLGDRLGKPLVIENRPGAGATIGADAAAKAAPDGYTLLLSSIVTQSLAPHLYTKLGYNAQKDFVPLAMIGSAPTVMIASPNLKVKTVQDVVSAARAAPGKLTYASGGSGTSPHIAAEVFRVRTKTELLHVPFKGGGPSLTALMAGDVDLMLDTAASCLPHVRSGKVQGIAISTPQRLAEFPALPTFAESGLADFDFNSWYSVHAPAATPAPIVSRLRADLAAVLAMPEVQAQVQKLGVEPLRMTGEQIAAFERSEYDKWGQVIRLANIRLD